MYLEYFGFTKEPFAASIAVEHLFKSNSTKELQSRFEHMLKFRGIMLLTGEPGAGKTTALRAMIENMSKKLYLPIYLPLATVGVSDFYRQLNVALGGENHFFKSVVYRSIQEQLLNHATVKGTIPVIVFDECHLMREQNFRELQIIGNFKMDTFMPAVFILAGQPLLRKRLEQHSLDSVMQRITLSYSLTGLTEEETKDYIQHHIKLAGRNDSLIDAKACNVVFSLTRGTPRLIGTLVKKSLIAAMMKNEQVVDADDVLLASKEMM